MLLLTWKPGCNSAFTEKSAVPPRWMVRRVAGAMLRTALPGAWACKQGQGAASRSSSVGARRLEQVNNRILEFLFPHGDGHVNRRDLPLPVNEQRGWQRVQPAVRGADIVVAQQDAVIHLHVLGVGFDGGPSVFIHGYPYHREALIFELPFEIHKPRNLDLAGAAPGGPEVQQHHFASIIGGTHHLAVRVFQAEPGCRPANCVVQVEGSRRGLVLLAAFGSGLDSAKVRASGPQKRAGQRRTNANNRDSLGHRVSPTSLYRSSDRDRRATKMGPEPFRPPIAVPRRECVFRMPPHPGVDPGRRVAETFAQIIPPGERSGRAPPVFRN